MTALHSDFKVLLLFIASRSIITANLSLPESGTLHVTGTCLQIYQMFACVCVCFCYFFQSPTAQQCGWWCLWCACQWWLSQFSSLSSSAPWDTTAVCRAPRVRGRVAAASACRSTRRHCSFHSIITNLSVCQLYKGGGGCEEGVCSNYANHPNFLFLLFIFYIIFMTTQVSTITQQQYR